MSVTRRDLLRFGALGAGAAASGLVLPLGRSVSTKAASDLDDSDFPRPFDTEFTGGARLRGRLVRGPLPDGTEGEYRLFTVIERRGSAQLTRDRRTPVYAYGYVDDDGVERPPRIPGPTIKVDRGVPVKLRVVNRLPAEHPQFGHPFYTSTHLHGSASLPQYDGYANDCTYPGHYKDYWYPNFQGARTIWYHDHGVHHTSENAYGGLAAQYHLHDRIEERDLPAGAYDVPVTVSDVFFGEDSRLAFDDHEFSGLWGDVVLVNGRPWPVMRVKRRVYRFRVLNASISRSYRFHLSDGSPMTIVGTDGGLMPEPVTVDEYRHGGAERYELLIDFSRYRGGDTVDLRNRSNKNNVDFDHTDKVMRFLVSDDDDFPTNRNTLTPRLPVADVMTTSVSESSRLRRWEMDHDDVTNIFKISGKTWQDVVDSGFTDSLTGNTPAPPGGVEVWELENNSGGWFHPFHIHLTDFRVLSRNGRAPFPYEAGPKDVVYLGEDETVRLLMKFTLPPGASGGKYMVHCHNLPHEDHDMMSQFVVGQPGPEVDPIAAAPPQPVRGPAGTDGDLELYGDGVLV